MDDIINIVHRMYEKDGISKNDVVSIVKIFYLPTSSLLLVLTMLPLSWIFITIMYIF